MSNAEHEKFRQEVLEQREIEAIECLGLPFLKAGMSDRAVSVQLKRAARRAEVRERLLKAWEEEKRAAQQPEPTDPAEGAARALLAALDSGGEQKQRAEQFLKTAHPRIRERLHELAEVDSKFKRRRSNKPNGF